MVFLVDGWMKETSENWLLIATHDIYWVATRIART